MAHLLPMTLAWTFIGLLIIVVGYQYILLLVLILTRKGSTPSAKCTTHFTVLIPAHNEQSLLAKTLASAQNLDYPESRFRIVVVADNCTDRTVEIAQDLGVECWERYDEERRGKGYALEWAFQKLAEDVDQAVVVLDADSKASPNLLKIFDAYLSSGYEAVQSANLLERTEDNLFTTFMALGNLITNYYIYLPKFRMGSTAFLLGTGMCFRHSLIKHYYQDEYSISEDIDYSLRLIHKNVRIAFASEAHVETIHPHEIRSASTQRVRWSSGTYALLWKNAWTCLKRGLRERSLLFLDTAFSLISWSKALIGVLFGAALPLAFVVGRPLNYVVLVLLLSYLIYLFLGVFLLRRRNHNIWYLFLAPVLVPWLMVISVLGVFGFRKTIWQRTARD